MNTARDYIELHLNFALYGMLGLLSRVGLERLCAHQGPFSGVLFSNFVGCMLMGFVVEHTFIRPNVAADNDNDDDDAREGKNTPLLKGDTVLYNALATGNAGAFTSFSSLVLETFTYAANITPGPAQHMPFPNPAWGLPMAMAYLVVSTSVSFGGYLCGRHIAATSEQGIATTKGRRPARVRLAGFRLRTARRIECVGAVLGALGYATVLALLLATMTAPHLLRPGAAFSPPWRYWLMALACAPPAVVLRYWTIRLVNPLRRGFPLGTFACNVLGSAVLAALVLLQRGAVASRAGSAVAGVVAGRVRCDVVRGLADGFCGGLSTVSTLVNEMYGLGVARAYPYGATSFAAGFSCMALILGTYIWTNGVADACY